MPSLLSGPVAELPEQALARINSREKRYRLGQFFTPEPIAELMAEAVLEIDPETCLDPGVGGGVLLRAVGCGPARLGCDVDPAAVVLARDALEAQGGEVDVVVGDFLDLDRWPFEVDELDAIIANPPYIRHHNLSRGQKALAKHYSRSFGVSVSSLSGSYVYFFLEAIRRLRFGGRLAFITPAEFLDVRYGHALKEALLSWCEIDELIVLEMDELAFEGVLTTSAITIATKRERVSRRVPLTEARLSDAIVRVRGTVIESGEALPERPWTALLPSRAERILPLLAGRSATLADYARVRRGIATGDNSFFCLTQEDVDGWGIEPRFLVPAVAGSKDLPENGSVLTREFWRARKDAGARAWLLFCHEPKSALAGTAVLRYIEHGEALGLTERFNCRTRKPWYGVERVPPADFFVTYMSRQRARFVRNELGARCLSALLNVWAGDGIDPDELRPMLEDQANARLLREFGRTYGGGLGKIEPADLLRLPVRPLAAPLSRAA